MTSAVPELIPALIGSFFGTLGFALLVQVPRRAWIPSGLVAVLAYMVYWGLMKAGIPESISIFFGALFGALAGKLCARRMKMIGTVFMMSAVVPVVPGLGLYRMMSYLGQGETQQGANLGVQVMITIAMIALGLGVGSFVERRFRHGGQKP